MSRRESGQVLVLACISLFVLCLVTVSTVDIGQRVHERIQLQNAADAAAYSMAATEARAFNFYAYTNRAQASHYVNAMIWHSTISFFYFLEAYLTDGYGVLRTLFLCGEPDGIVLELVCPILEAIPELGQLLKAIFQIFVAIKELVQGLQAAAFRPAELWLDKAVGQFVIPGHRLLNQALLGASKGVFGSALSYVTSEAENVVNANDPNAKPYAPLVLGALSSCLFQRAHDDAAWKDFTIPARGRDESDRAVRAKRVMAQIANASRFACEGKGLCPERFVTSRGIADMLQLPESMQGAASFLVDMGSAQKFGQTRLLGVEHGDGREQNNVFNWIHTNNSGANRSTGPLGSGDVLAADDLYTLTLGTPTYNPVVRNPFSCSETDDPLSCYGDPRLNAGPHGDTGMTRFGKMVKTSVFAASKADGFRNDGGIHWRVAYPAATNPSTCNTKDCGWVAPKYYSKFGLDGLGPYDEGELGVNKFDGMIYSLDVTGVLSIYVANVRGIQDGNHPWEGMVGFPHFEPGQFSSACPGGSPSNSEAASREDEFNQPSTLVALTHEDAAKSVLESGDDDEGDGEVHAPIGEDVKLKLSAEDAPIAIARAQAYYHRPGNWMEHPNFFNPFWRARLAPVIQAKGVPLLDQIVGMLPEQLKGAVTH